MGSQAKELLHHTWPDPLGARPPCKIFTRVFKYKAKHQEIHFPAWDAGPPIRAPGKREGTDAHRDPHVGTDGDNAGL